MQLRGVPRSSMFLRETRSACAVNWQQRVGVRQDKKKGPLEGKPHSIAKTVPTVYMNSEH